MHVIAIPIVHDKKKDCKKISITELWKGKFSYRKFQDYMYNEVGKKYGSDRGEMQDYSEAEKHLEVEAFKLKEAEKSLNKLDEEIRLKEQSLIEQAKDLEPEEHINIFNIKAVVEEQKAINLALKMEKNKNSLSHIYNPNTEQENLNIMNKALKKSDKKLENNSAHTMHISAHKKIP